MIENQTLLKSRIALTRGDKVVTFLGVLVLLLLYHTYWLSDFGGQVEILVNGKHWSSYDLYGDYQIEVPGSLGLSKILIHAGKVRFVESPCDGHRCIHQGWLQYGGEFAACLPNRISMRILGANSRFDTVNF